MRTLHALSRPATSIPILTCALLIGCQSPGSTPITTAPPCQTSDECLHITESIDSVKCPVLPHPYVRNVAIYLKNNDRTTAARAEIFATIRQTRIDYSIRPPAETTLSGDKYVNRTEPLYLGCKYYLVPDIEHVIQYSYVKLDSCFTAECKSGPLPPGKTNPPRDPRPPQQSCIDACSNGVGGSCLGLQAVSNSPSDLLISSALAQFRTSVISDPLPTSANLASIFNAAGAVCGHTSARINAGGRLSSYETSECLATFGLAKNSLDVEALSVVIPGELQGSVLRNLSEGTIDFSDEPTAPKLRYRYATDPKDPSTESVSKIYFRNMITNSGYPGIIAEGKTGYCFYIEYKKD